MYIDEKVLPCTGNVLSNNLEFVARTYEYVKLFLFAKKLSSGVRVVAIELFEIGLCGKRVTASSSRNPTDVSSAVATTLTRTDCLLSA